MSPNRLFLFACLFLGIILRLPAAIYQDLHPFQFCDEDIFSGEVLRMLTENRFFTKEFRSGGFNIYSGWILGKIMSLITGQTPTINEITIATRLALAVFLNTTTLFILYKIAAILNFSRKEQNIMILSFTLSPLILGVSRQWYPDHYLVFFASLTLLFILQTTSQFAKSTIHFKTGLSIGALASVKYTGLFLFLPYGISFLTNIEKDKTLLKSLKNALLKYKSTLCLFLIGFFLVFFIFQVSAFINPGDFIDGFSYNLKNYSRGTGINWNGILFYFVVLLGSSLGICAIFFYSLGARLLYSKNKSAFWILISLPLFICLYLGKSHMVINRNILITMPFVLPLFAIGVGRMYDLLNRHVWVAHVLCICLFIEPTLKSFHQFMTDLEPNARMIAREWVSKNLPQGSSIGHNEFCSGESPASKDEFNLLFNPNTQKPAYQYYIHNTWWESPFTQYLAHAPLLLQLNYSNLHFYNFNDQNPLSFFMKADNLDKLTQETGHKIIKEFNGGGPRILILQPQI